MNRGGGDDELGLEIIELEPAEGPRAPRAEEPREPGARGRRAPLVIALVVLVALVGSVTLNRTRGSNHGSTSTTHAGQADISLDSRPLFPFRVGARVLTAGSDGLQLLDTDTGHRAELRIKGLPDSAVTIIAQSDGTVAVRVERTVYWFSLDDRIAHEVQGDIAFPAAQSGHLWFAGPEFATEVPGAPHPVETHGQAVGATRAGLLVVTKAGVMLQPTGDSGDRAAILLVHAPANVIGVHADRFAWTTNDCGVLRCPVHVTEVESDATSTWLQFVGKPNPLMVAGASASFSPDGNYLVIIVPDVSVTIAQTLYLADLRSRATHVVYIRGRFAQPARPGTDDATGNTIGWTLDSRFVLFAPESGSGAIGAMDPATARIVSSRAPIGIVSTNAVIGTSAAGPLDLPRHRPTAGVDTSGPTTFRTPGLTLVGLDDHQVDVVDLTSGKTTTRALGRTAYTEGSSELARVAGGWLAVRSFGSPPDDNTVVELLRDGGDAIEVANGMAVYSARGGTLAWIVDNDYSHVRTYDPVTGALGRPISFAGQLAALDAGLIVASYSESQTQTRLDLIDPLGNLHRGTGLIDSPFVEILDSGGTRLIYHDDEGVHAFDTATSTERFITELPVASLALSPDGENVAWVYDDFGPPTGGSVRAIHLDDEELVSTLQTAGEIADRVLVANDGTVLFTSGNELRRGRVDDNGSSLVSGYAPKTTAGLALG